MLDFSAGKVLKARPENIANLHLITPTIRYIADTPNGRSLSWLFHPLPRILASKLTSIFGTYIPAFLLKVLFWDWPAHQITVLQRLLNSPESVLACLEMSHDEMQSVKEADFEFIASHDNRIRIYFAGKDGWVGKHKQVIMSELKTSSPRTAVAIGPDVPHAFCINHSQQVALRCLQWLAELS
ncbi:hypothetical protein EDD85DRAFT_27138 [Armillaria nabsnona]|nr:hypothetical protein EDD85DRAFT_27138 [Armillaria nabsnona]